MSLLPISGGNLNVSGTGTTEDVAGVAVNTSHGGVSEYTNFPFNSIMVLGGTSYGATGTTVYQLSGERDITADVDAAFLTGVADFSTENAPDVAVQNKRVDSVYVNARIYNAGGAIRARVNEVTDRLYNSPGASGYPEGLAPMRVKFGRGLKGRNWQLGYENRDGDRFEIERFDARVVILSRKV
jgi:hypothetical protein